MIASTSTDSKRRKRGWRGFGLVYRAQEKNFCPGCGSTHWWLGRMSAECVNCGTALPLADVQFSGCERPVRCGIADGTDG